MQREECSHGADIRVVPRRQGEKFMKTLCALGLTFILAGVATMRSQNAPASSTPSAPAAAEIVPQGQNSLPAGSLLYIRLDTPVSTASSKVHQAVKAHVVRQIFTGNQVAVPLGATLEGEIAQIHQSANPDDPAVLVINFTQLTLPGEKPLKISGHLFKIENARETVLKDGTIQGVRASDLGSTYVSKGLEKLSQQLPSLSSVIGGFEKKQVGTPDTAISYPQGTDMQVRLDKPLPVEKTFAPAAAEELPGPILNAVTQVLATAPQRTSTQTGTPGDPINLVIVGNEQQVREAFSKAGWDVPAEKQNQSVLKTVQAVVQGRGYDTAPISNLYLFKRPQDLAYEKMLNTFAMRHHLRLWRSPARTADGREIWLGAAVHDTGFDIHPGVASHATSPYLDAERAKVGADLIDTGLVAATQLVTPPHPLSHGTTGTGGAWETDGKLLVIDLK